MKKSEAMSRWRELPANQNPLPLMDVIPYQSEGSRYGACGVRIDGSPEFIDAVLSCLKAAICETSARRALRHLSLRAADYISPFIGKVFVAVVHACHGRRVPVSLTG